MTMDTTGLPIRATTRRNALKTGFAAALLSGCTTAKLQAGGETSSGAFESDWANATDRVFLGGNVWANPMEDWRIEDGRAITRTTGGQRNVQLLTHQLQNPNSPFEMAVEVERLAGDGEDEGAGFRLGVRADINEYRANAFANGGLVAGLRDGKLQIGDKSVALDRAAPSGSVILRLSATPAAGQVELMLEALTPALEPLGSVMSQVNADKLLGNVAIVANYGIGDKKDGGSRYAFHNWAVNGPAFAVRPERAFGPILWSMYALSDSRSHEGHVLKVSVLTGPMDATASRDVQLQIRGDSGWQTVATEQLDTDAWTAVFRVARWDASKAHDFRALYREPRRDGSFKTHEWAGRIQAEPRGRALRLAALTCQKDYGFPYEPVARNVEESNPDLVFFSGDQLYEGHGGFGLIRDHPELSILNYLRKYYMHGWAFRECMRNAPTLCIPDDHDVFQGNYWGEGGAQMDPKYWDQKTATSERGGYRQPVRMVNAVHRSSVAHHPDFYDPTPIKQGMSVYYGDMVYGNVSFAILGDRQFKSGPGHVDTGEGRADHVPDPDFDTRSLDKPGLVLLGDRQEKFLREWSKDWRGHAMKVLLSQTLFANPATHHGYDEMYLKGDLDSGGWPQTPRDRAIDILRPTKCLHVNGDQHLTSLIQYGVKEQRDSTWSFCVPAIAAGYPRSWRPDDVGMPHTDRPAHGLPQTGAYRDGFDNLLYVYAVGYPEAQSMDNRYDIAHQKGSGFGLVTIDTEKREYLIESFKFLVNLNDPDSVTQFPGWPVRLTEDGVVKV